MRVLKNDYIMDWEDNKAEDIKKLTSKGVLPAIADRERMEKSGKEIDFKTQMDMMPLLMGQAAGAIDEILPAKDIIDEMMSTATKILKSLQAQIVTEAPIEAQARL
eukprot:SAG31_NODE_14174_length_823_cov_1.720994_1_plen_106_part_00